MNKFFYCKTKKSTLFKEPSLKSEHLKEIILRHYKYTNSQKAKELVEDFDRFEPYFWLVLPAASNIHDLLKATTANAA